MKRILISLLVFFCLCDAYAGHIAGGEMYYSYLGPGNLPKTNRYQITLRLFRECNAEDATILPDYVGISVFKDDKQIPVASLTLPQATYRVIKLAGKYDCVKFAPEVCYQITTYTYTIQLSVIPEDYTITYQTCCRSISTRNVRIKSISPDEDLAHAGATYMCTIPGTDKVASSINSSPVYALKDTVLVCANAKINLDFSATDADGDSLSYVFCDAYNGGKAVSPNPTIPSAPPYAPLEYIGKYDGGSPLGDKVYVDWRTGIITGLTPPAGKYVVNVCAVEWRRGVQISVHRKDFIISVSNCDIPSATLAPVTVSCESPAVHFTNESASASIDSYYWDFGTGQNTSTEPQPVFTYPDTGIYLAKLVVNPGQKCRDSSTTLVKVYPGFHPDFTVSGSCYTSPFQFTDATTAKYGIVDSWYWQFDNSIVDDNTSFDKEPKHYYSDTGTHSIKLTVGSSKGCIDTIAKQVYVRGKLGIKLPFKDTLICRKDSLLLTATADELSYYSWQPSENIYRFNTQTPIVFPDNTTKFIVTANTGNGCISKDSLIVNVVDHTTLTIGNDTAVCSGDTIWFHPVSNALHFAWQPDSTLSDSTSKDLYAVPVASFTNYRLRASISRKCFADGDVVIHAPPYPKADAGEDLSVCFGYATQLQASYSGSVFAWSPTSTLLHGNTLTPTAGPQNTTIYTLTVKDTTTSGCPKPVTDSVTIRVIPPLQVFAGNDTNIVVNQPLLLHATGATKYFWGPVIGISNANSQTPTVLLTSLTDSISYNVKGFTPEGCIGYDTLTVFVYKTLPDVFVPTAFSPNADGLNDRLIPVTAGIKTLENFCVFNRAGQLLYNTSRTGDGWDGTMRGTKQPGGTYVYLVRAIDYIGKRVVKKGTIVLIR